MSTSESIRPEELLEHVEWARALARRLVRDESTADDVAQEAMTTALAKPPEASRPVRPWIARVVQNVARQRARSEGRRGRREREAARGMSVPSTAELTERAEAHGLLVEALLGLDEGTRQVILLRYFEGLSSAEIARSLGEPHGTVRSRLSRGLGKLREGLDARFGGDRSVWHGALAPLLRFPLVPASTGVAAALFALPIAVKLSISAVVAALCLLGFMALGGASLLPSSASRLESVVLHRMEPLESSPDALEGLREPLAVAVPTGNGEPSAGSLSPDQVAIALRFVDPTGLPVNDVDVRLWSGLRHKSDANGSLRLEAKQGTRSPASIVASRVGFASDSFAIQFPSEGTLDAGDLVLRPGGAIEGRVVGEGVDLEHLLVTVQGREVAAISTGGMRTTTRSGLGAAVAETDLEGRFRLDGLLPGEVLVQVESEDKRVTGKSRRVVVQAGQVSRGLEISVRALPLDQLVGGSVLDPEGAPVPYASIRFEWGSFFASGSGSRAADKDGRFLIVLDRPRTVDLTTFGAGGGAFDEARLDGVPSGTLDATLRLTRARTLWVNVVLTDQAPMEGRILARVSGEDRLLHEGILGKLPIDVTVPRSPFVIVVEADRHRAAKSRRLDPDELPEELELRPEPLPRLFGRVMDGDVPAEGASITVRRKATRRVHVSDLRSMVDPDVVVQATSNVEGHFDLTLRKRGTYVVRAELDGRAAAEYGPVRLDPDSPPGGLLLELTGGGSIRGRVNDGDTLQQTRVLLASRGDGLARTTRTQLDGTFQFEHLTPGPWRVQVTDSELTEGMSSSSTEFGSSFEDVDPNCSVVEGRITWFDLATGAAVPGATLAGRFHPSGLAASRFVVRLEPAKIVPGTGLLETSARVSLDGSFVVQSAATGEHSLFFEEVDEPDEKSRLRFLVPMDLPEGESNLHLSIPAGQIQTGPSANPERQGLLWRGPDGVTAFSGLAPVGEGRWFPAGEVSLIPLWALDYGMPARSSALDDVELAEGASEVIGQ